MICSDRLPITEGFADEPDLGIGCDRQTAKYAVAFLLLLILALALAGCQSYPQAEASLKTGISVNEGHAADEKLPKEARAIAEDNGDLMWKVLYSIGGCEEKDIPIDVRERQKERAQ